MMMTKLIISFALGMAMIGLRNIHNKGLPDWGYLVKQRPSFPCPSP